MLANLNLTRKTTIIMVTHDNQVGLQTQRMLLLKDGKIVKEKQGLLLSKKGIETRKASDNFTGTR